MTPELSLVIPVYNEGGNILPLAESAVNVLRELGRPFEIIFVNDGSTDDTSDEITAANRRWRECRELRMIGNTGQAFALFTGLRAAAGEYILTMDGDGQNDPRDFPYMLAQVERGKMDMICGWRTHRLDPGLRLLMSRIANIVRRFILQDGVHDAGCQIRVMRKEVKEAFFPMELMQSFIPALAVAAGYKVGEVPVRHHPRAFGEAKYTLGRLWWRPAAAMLKLRWKIWRGQIPKRKQALWDL